MASVSARRWWRGLAIAGYLAVAVALVSLAVSSLVVAPVVENATSLDDIDLALGSVAVTRSAVNQATVFAVGAATGAASDESLAAALGEANANLDALEAIGSDLVASSPSTGTGVLTLVADGREIVRMIFAGDVDGARSTVQATFEPTYRNAVDSLVAARAGLISSLNGAMGAWGARLGWIAGALAAPAMAAMVVRLAMGRRMARSRRRMHAELAAAEDSLAMSNELIRSVSHRFRNPLAGIQGLSAVLSKAPSVTGLNHELATLVHAEAAELHRIVDDVLTATQLQAGTLRADPAIVELAGMIDDVVTPHRSRGVEVDVGCEPVWVVTDAEKLRQILRNLVTNAAVHGAEPVEIAVVEVDGVVSVQISDRGEGLSRTEPQHPALTAERLGLYVAYSLAELLGITLEHERRAERTTFTLRLSEESSAGSIDDVGVESAPVAAGAELEASGS